MEALAGAAASPETAVKLRAVSGKAPSFTWDVGASWALWAAASPLVYQVRFRFVSSSPTPSTMFDASTAACVSSRVSERASRYRSELESRPWFGRRATVLVPAVSASSGMETVASFGVEAFEPPKSVFLVALAWMAASSPPPMWRPLTNRETASS